MLASRAFLASSLCCVLVAIIFFLPGLGGGFIFDDNANVVENTALHLSAMSWQDLPYAAYSFQPGKGSRSLAMFSFAVDYWRGGLDASVFKTTNLIIHALTGVVLAYVFRLLLILSDCSERRAALTALVLTTLWTIHPLQISSVLYVVQRMQTLVTLFTVLAIWCYLEMRRVQLKGGHGRHFGLLALMFWALGLASKEDAILLPLYSLGIELTVLNFRAANQALENLWRRLYQGFLLVGVLGFLFYFLPRHWSWESYPGRDFSSFERLLTQGWILMMYLGQIFLPLPGNMPFYYDQIEVSRSLWSPWYVLPSWLLIACVFIFAWKIRRAYPLMALGIWIFFAGHFISSNIVNLEMAFEHRNHLPLIGAVMVFGEVGRWICLRYAIPQQVALFGACAVSIALASATFERAHAWGEPLRLAQWNVQMAPYSARAWLALCGTYFQRSNQGKDGHYLDQAIETCQQGAEIIQTPALFSNIIIFKTIRGDVTPEDWDIFLQNLDQAPMSAQNRKTLWVMLNSVDRMIPLDESGMLKTIDVVTRSATFEANEYLRIAAYIFNETKEPRMAFAFMEKATELSPRDDPAIKKMFSELSGQGLEDWVSRLQRIRRKKDLS